MTHTDAERSAQVEFRVGTTRGGLKVEKRDYRGLADGLFTKSYTRYFDRDEKQKAIDYADGKVEEIGGPARVAFGRGVTRDE